MAGVRCELVALNQAFASQCADVISCGRKELNALKGSRFSHKDKDHS